jgi:hypothetical protein
MTTSMHVGNKNYIDKNYIDLEFISNMSKNIEMFSKGNNEFSINRTKHEPRNDEKMSQHPRQVLKEHVNRQP